MIAMGFQIEHYKRHWGKCRRRWYFSPKAGCCGNMVAFMNCGANGVFLSTFGLFLGWRCGGSDTNWWFLGFRCNCGTNLPIWSSSKTAMQSTIWLQLQLCYCSSALFWQVLCVFPDHYVVKIWMVSPVLILVTIIVHYATCEYVDHHYWLVSSHFASCCFCFGRLLL